MYAKTWELDGTQDGTLPPFSFIWDRLSFGILAEVYKKICEESFYFHSGTDRRLDIRCLIEEVLLQNCEISRKSPWSHITYRQSANSCKKKKKKDSG